MNIWHIITRLIVGGAQENTLLTCRGLVERGHDVTLVAGTETGPEGSLWKMARDTGSTLVELRSLQRAVAPWRDWQAFREMRGLFAESRPDIVHTHSSKAGILGRAAAAAANVPAIIHTIHGMSFNRTQPFHRRAMYRHVERRAAKHTTAFVTVADAMTDQAVDAGIAPRSKFTTVYSGMETDRFRRDAQTRTDVRAEWCVDDNDIVVGTVARLFDNKGYDDLLEAMPAALQHDPRLKFVWIGDGPRREQYERRLVDIGLRDRVHFVGLIPPNDVPRHMQGFDIVLHASKWEGLPRALVQGLLMEVPAISYDVDGAPEVVIPNETGLLVPLGDTRALGDALVDLATDAQLRQRLGRNGQQLCARRFDWQTMVDNLEFLYTNPPPSCDD